MPAPRPADPLAVLQSVWGFDAFRPGQQDAIEAVLSGQDVLAVLPTGGGKSLLYQVPALLVDGLTLVVSPLIALMDDQVAGLARRGIRAGVAHGGLSARAMDQLWTDAEYGKYRLVYLTPERLETRAFLDRVHRLPVRLLAIDEAHCVSEWGHDFRPSYRRLGAAREAIETATGRPVPTLAVTATATPPVRADIQEQLALRAPRVAVHGFDRPNLVWSVHHVESKEQQVRRIFASVPGSGIVYAGTRRGTERWATRLARDGVTAEPYHAGLEASRRRDVQQRWMAGTTRVIVATSAFGMGVDKADVRAVVHVALPPTLDAYYQEAGRAGRDGARAYAALVVQTDDDAVPRQMAEDGHPTADIVRAVYDVAASLSQVALGARPDGPVVLDEGLLAGITGLTASQVRASIERIVATGVWTVRDARAHTVWLRGTTTPAATLAAGGEALRSFVEPLVRALPSAAFGEWTEIQLGSLSRTLGLPPDRVRAGLTHLSDRGLVQVLPPSAGRLVSWNEPRARALPLDGPQLAASRERALARLDDVVRYARGLGCRRAHLLAYFGEAYQPPCGRCDVCLGRLTPRVLLPTDEADLWRILDAVQAGAPRDAWLPGAAPPHRDALVHWLVAEGWLALVDPLHDGFALTPAGERRVRDAARAGTLPTRAAMEPSRSPD